MKKKSKLAPVRSISELYSLALRDENYKKLAIVASSNLGGEAKDLKGAIGWLEINALETDSEGVLDEINSCRDLI